ncbi:ATP-binding protein [Geomonas propionica]|uniref:AAA family ATPase n=1 Tax=Geomonas propionica TaxID=2798582 RepID=A0ABS0YP26_9BACT|nr:ATP-binding protein [Geomonas propionica]MBJ6799722.1 AAA family ATPase [Geomonas propionica]
MELGNYLMCVATRHQQAKEEHDDEQREIRARARSGRGRRALVLTYDDETALLKGVIGSLRGRPACLKRASYPAIGALAYLFKAKVAKDPYVEGYEIVDRLVYDPELTVVYLKALEELQELGWVRLRNTGGSFTDSPPFCWLQANVDFGDTFHREMGNAETTVAGFSSNDAYLDAIFSYLKGFDGGNSEHLVINDPDVNLETYQPVGWYRRCVQRVEVSSCQLPAAKAGPKLRLSPLQHLTLMGLLGQREGDLSYDFNDTYQVARLFARGRVCRQRVRKHLFGEKSPLLTQRLVESTQGTFGETVQLTQAGATALLGRHTGKKNLQNLRRRVKQGTFFDLEEPKIRQEALYLPGPVLEALQSVVFGESPKGLEVRKAWQASLPTAWGAPTGSTLLLYGPPGTGKTLTAQYLASRLERPLLKVDASRVLSCWVGESEQQVRRIFDDYAMLQREFGSAPVLLFNEADQLLGGRGAGTSAVDRMNNNMQNLFLEGLERFTGILVATTNRRDLLDEAFSRRFTYKLELPAPDRSLRMALWKEHLPLDRLAHDVDLDQLADLGLTGGEIRLVVERAVRLLAYRGDASIDVGTLTLLAREELAARMKRAGTAGRIGFAAQRGLST